MSPNVLNRRESVPSTTTLKRAQWEAFAFTVCPNGVVNVTNASYGPDATGHTYSVRLDTTTDDADGVPVSCSCPHHQHRDASCKHRVAVAITEPVRIAATHAGRDADVASAEGAETDAHADPRVLTDGGREPGQTTFTGAWHPAQETLDASAANDAGGTPAGDADCTPDDDRSDEDTSPAGDDDAPDECMCDGLPDDFPCWPCYRAGRKPLPSDDEDTDVDAGGHAHSITGPYVDAAADGSLTGRAYYRCEECEKEAMTRADIAAFDCE
jgi:hypothetical protein